MPFHEADVVSELSRNSVKMNAPVPEATESATVDESSKTATDLHPAIRVFGMILAAIAATAVCYTTVAGIGNVYPTPPEVLSLGGRPTEAERAAASAAQRAANTGNAMVWLGVCGAILGECFRCQTAYFNVQDRKRPSVLSPEFLQARDWGLWQAIWQFRTTLPYRRL